PGPCSLSASLSGRCSWRTNVARRASRNRPRAGRPSGRRGREGAEDLAPACGRVEDRLHLGGLLAVGVEAAVLELDSGAALARGDEADIDLGVEVGVMAPVGADLPVEHQPFGRLVGDHPPPLALAAVDAAL